MFFATLGNKLRKITKIFEEPNPIKAKGSSANSKQSKKLFLRYSSGFEIAWLEVIYFPKVAKNHSSSHGQH